MAMIFTAIGSAITSAGGAGAAAAGAAAAGSGVVTLSNVLSAGSALAAIGQGMSQRNQLEAQAQFAQTQAAQEEAAGAQQARNLAREYAELRGEQQVIQLANGLDIGVGTPVSVGQSTARMADRNLDITRRNAGNRAAMSRLRARGLMSEARASMMQGFGSALSTGLNAYQLTGN